MMRMLISMLALVFALSSCTSATPPEMYVKAGPSPHIQYASFPAEEAALRCFANTEWGQGAMLTNIGVVHVLDASGKMTLGENGTGAMVPVNSASSATAAVNMLAGPASPINALNREKWMMDTMLQEVQLALRDAPVGKLARADYFLNGTISGIDAIVASVQQYVMYGVGGGPSQQRWDIVLDMQLTDATNTHTSTRVPYTTSVKYQFVQSEIKIFAAKIMFGGEMKSYAGADVEEVIRSEMQTMLKPMIYRAVADLARQLPGAPATCGNNIQKLLTTGA